ncbi:MAG: cytochrome c [Deltaproteobacteria bacterium]|nr:cytochrome c [Deltaproteobacteria bacterium]
MYLKNCRLPGVLFAAVFFGASGRSFGNDAATVKLFESECSTCHGKDGKGKTSMGRKKNVEDWTDGDRLSKVTDDEMKAILEKGIKDKDGNVTMKPPKKVQAGQFDALIKYSRSLSRGK